MEAIYYVITIQLIMEMIENSLGINYCGNNCYNENLTILPREKKREMFIFFGNNIKHSLPKL